MLRPVALLGVAAFVLSACASGDSRRDSALDTVLRQISTDLREDSLCLHRSLAVRQTARQMPGIYIEAPVPAGFGIVDVPADGHAGPLELEETGRPLPAGWRVGDGARAGGVCFELTIPVVEGERAVVSAQPVMPSPLERTNYWLRWTKDRWEVAAVTKGRWDI